MKIVVGGGTGFVGKYLCALLKQKGHEVVVVSTRSSAKPPVQGCSIITWDSLASEGLPSGTKAAVNLAGANILDPTKRWASYSTVVRESRLKTTRAFVDAIQSTSSKPDVFVSASAVGYYPPSPTATYDENSVCQPSNFIEQLVHDWEAAAELSTDDTRTVKLRIGVVIGKGGGIIGNMWFPFYLGLGGPVGNGRQWFPWVHVHDVAGIILHAIETSSVTGVLNAVAPSANSNGDFAKALGAAMWRPSLLPLPGFVVNTVFGSERGSVMLEGQRVHPKRTLEAGYVFQFPVMKEACEEVASWK